ncbi:MAG: NAD-dependent deacylase [Bacteroidetes bacterium]|nr:NAD-dependent deacylase [Bacteroidota bacterium]
MKRIVVFTGAGISAESGIKTFRDSDGLWENYAVEDVATPQAWYKNPEMVLEFYNQRRKQIIQATPNAAHKALVELEKEFDVTIITQNIDDLHERAGSSHIVHLHGEIMKSRSTINASLIYALQSDCILIGDKCEKGSQLRPHIVWFGEAVPMMEEAISITQGADIFIIIGTSLAVYPAASLIQFTKANATTILVDPNADAQQLPDYFTVVAQNATEGVPLIVNKILKAYV